MIIKVIITTIIKHTSGLMVVYHRNMGPVSHLHPSFSVSTFPNACILQGQTKILCILFGIIPLHLPRTSSLHNSYYFHSYTIFDQLGIMFTFQHVQIMQV